MIPGMNAAMMLGGRSSVISIVNSTTAQYSSSITNPSINVPAGVVDGDLLVAFWQCGAAGWTPPAGWTELVDTAPLDVSYKIASGEPSSYTFTHSSNTFAGIMVALRGAAIDVAGTVASTLTASSITLAKNNSLLLGFFGGSNNAAFTAPSGMTSVASALPASGASNTGSLFSQYPVSAGATGTRTSTGGFGGYGSILLGIKPK